MQHAIRWGKMEVAPITHIGWTASKRWKNRWARFWMRYAGLSTMGRAATLCAALFAPPHKERVYLSKFNLQGYISFRAKLFHKQMYIGNHVFIDDHALLFDRYQGGVLRLGSEVRIYRYNILETAYGGTLEIGDRVSIHPKCQLNAYVSGIRIGSGTMLAPCCALYSYDHGLELGQPIRNQPLRSRGGIHIGSEAWLGYGTIVLDGVTIGDGAVIGAGSVVTQNVPDNTIAVGNPARVVRHRRDFSVQKPFGETQEN